MTLNWDWTKTVGGSKFGHKDYVEALTKKNITKQQVQSALQAGDIEITADNPLRGILSQTGNQAAQNQLGGSGFGHADYYHALQSGADAMSIQDAAKGQIAQSNLGGLGASIQASGDAARSLQIAQTDAAAAQDWRASESAKSEKYYSDMLAEQGKQLQAMQDAEAARAADALKVKYQGSTSVGAGQSAMGIKFKQSPAYASGAASRGTGQLARSDKGTKLKTLNV